MRIVDQVFQEVGGIEHRLVAGRDEVAEAEAAQIGQETDAQPAALRHDADIAGELVGLADFLKVGRVALDWVEDAHAVGAAQRDPGIAANAGDVVLQRPPLVAALGEAAVIDHGAAYAALGRRDKRIEDQPVPEAEHRDIGRLRRLGDARIALPAEHTVVVRIDRVDGAGEADPAQRDDQPPPDRRLLRRAEDGNRTWPEQRLEPHPRPFPDECFAACHAGF